MKRDSKSSRLTVVLPNYNHGEYIADALLSALNQTHPPHRILVLDDRSEDESIEIVRALAARHPTIDLIENPNRLGVNGNTNRGLQMVDTEFVTFLAADDVVLPALYETAIQMLGRFPRAAFCATAQRWIDADGKPVPQPEDPPIAKSPVHFPPKEAIQLLSHYGSFLAGAGAVYRTKDLHRHGFFWSAAGPFADTLAQAILTAESGLCYIPERLACWRRLDRGYALSQRRDPASGLAVLRFVANHTSARSGSPLPVALRDILLRRLTFDTVRSALVASPADFATIQAALHGSVGAPLLRLVHGIGGARMSVPLAMLLLRARDIPFAVRRRMS